VKFTVTTTDVRHADGTRLQRVGIQPNIVVYQTVAGVRSGRDEQLEAAQKPLAQARHDQGENRAGITWRWHRPPAARGV
jgi:C-terminal processing protease CtpA/Prc